MTHKSYLYTGPATGFTLGEGEFMAYPGRILALPPEHPLTLAWAAQNYAVPTEQEAPPPPNPTLKRGNKEA